MIFLELLFLSIGDDDFFLSLRNEISELLGKCPPCQTSSLSNVPLANIPLSNVLPVKCPPCQMTALSYVLTPSDQYQI